MLCGTKTRRSSRANIYQYQFGASQHTSGQHHWCPACDSYNFDSSLHSEESAAPSMHLELADDARFSDRHPSCLVVLWSPAATRGDESDGNTAAWFDNPLLQGMEVLGCMSAQHLLSIGYPSCKLTMLTLGVTAPLALTYTPRCRLAASPNCFFMRISYSRREVSKKLFFMFINQMPVDHEYDSCPL